MSALLESGFEFVDKQTKSLISGFIRDAKVGDIPTLIHDICGVFYSPVAYDIAIAKEGTLYNLFVFSCQ